MQFRFSKALVSLSVCHTLVCVSCHRLLWVQQKLVIIARKIQKDLLKLNFVDLYCQLFGKKNSFVCDFHPVSIHFFIFPRCFGKHLPLSWRLLSHCASLMWRPSCRFAAIWLTGWKSVRPESKCGRSGTMSLNMSFPKYFWEVTMGFGKKKIPNN